MDCSHPSSARCPHLARSIKLDVLVTRDNHERRLRDSLNACQLSGSARESLAREGTVGQ